MQIDTGADLLALKELDQKLWVALSCPTRGIEFDTKTLDLIDSDDDARVHANEVLGAIGWAGRLLRNPDLLVQGGDSLALTEIDDATEEGQQVFRFSALHPEKPGQARGCQDIPGGYGRYREIRRWTGI